LTGSWPTSRTPTRRPGTTWSTVTATSATRSTARSPTATPRASATSWPSTPPRWHLSERHLLVDSEPVTGALFDFGLYVFHCAHRLVRNGSAPYFYLPKM